MNSNIGMSLFKKNKLFRSDYDVNSLDDIIESRKRRKNPKKKPQYTLKESAEGLFTLIDDVYFPEGGDYDESVYDKVEETMIKVTKGEDRSLIIQLYTVIKENHEKNKYKKNAMEFSKDIQVQLEKIKNSKNTRPKSLDIETSYKICMIGEGGVGKSCITTRYVKYQYEEIWNPTISDSFTKLINVSISQNERRAIKLNIMDTAGQEEYRCLNDIDYKGHNGYVLVCDITTLDTVIKLKSRIEQILRINDSDTLTAIICLNKLDLKEGVIQRKKQLDSKIKKKILDKKIGKVKIKKINKVINDFEKIENEAMNLVNEFNLSYIKTSAKTGKGIDVAFDYLIMKVREKEKLDKLNKIDDNDEKRQEILGIRKLQRNTQMFMELNRIVGPMINVKKQEKNTEKIKPTNIINKTRTNIKIDSFISINISPRRKKEEIINIDDKDIMISPRGGRSSFSFLKSLNKNKPKKRKSDIPKLSKKSFSDSVTNLKQSLIPKRFKNNSLINGMKPKSRKFSLIKLIHKKKTFNKSIKKN